MTTIESEARIAGGATRSGLTGQEVISEMPADEALQLLRAGSPLRNVRVTGLLLSGEFDRPLEMHRVTLVDCHIEQAVFRAPVALTHCRLQGWKVRRKPHFAAGLKLCGSTLQGAAFHGARIEGSFDCGNVEFRAETRFRQCDFDAVRYWQAQFRGWLEFRNCRFRGAADMRSFHAHEGVTLADCTFEDDLLLRGSTVGKKLDFGDSRFRARLDLAKTKLHDFVYLENIQQGESQRFAFANGLIERMLITPSQITGRLASELEGDHQLAMAEYGLLQRNFQNLHRYDEEDWALYRFKVNQRRAKRRSWARPWTKLGQFSNWLLLDHGCGYCTDPMRAVRAAVIIMLLFAAIFMAGMSGFSQSEPIVGQTAGGLANRAVFGLLTSVSVFTAGFTGDHLHNARGWVLIPLAVEALMGTLLWGLFIVAFSRKVIR